MGEKKLESHVTALIKKDFKAFIFIKPKNVFIFT